MKKIALCLFSVLIVGCSSKVEVHKEHFKTTDGSLVEVLYGSGRPGYGMPANMDKGSLSLRVITRGDMATRIAGKGIFCNPLSLLAMVRACKWDENTFNKEDIEGEITPHPNIAVSYAYPKYLEMLRQNLSFTETKDYTVSPIHFYPKANILVYDEDHYKLKAGFQIYVYGSRVGGEFNCEEEKSGVSYEKWIENNYALAVQESKTMMDSCLKRLDKFHFKHLQEQLEHTRKFYL